MKKFLILFIGLLAFLTSVNSMSLFSPGDVEKRNKEQCAKQDVQLVEMQSQLAVFDGIEQGKTYQYFSQGIVNTNDLLWRILKRTGPADLCISTWSMGRYVADQFIKKYDKGLFTSAKFLMDTRCKANSKTPIYVLQHKFDVRLCRIHAKIILLKNENWRLTAITSSNMQRNSRIEIGCVFTDELTFDFHNKWFNYVYDNIPTGRVSPACREPTLGC